MKDNAGIAISKGNSIAIEQVSLANDNMTKSHYHTHFELYYLEAGIRYHMVEDTIYCLYPGDFILYPPYVMHRSYSGQDIFFKRIVIYFTSAAISDPRIFSRLSKHAWLYRKDEGDGVLKILYEVMQEQEHGDQYSAKYNYFLLNQLLVKLARNAMETELSDGENRLTNIIRYLHEHFADQVTLEDLASHFYISSSYLCREFKRYTNCTVIQYVNSLRIRHAQRLLQETDKSITEISTEVGFQNVTHFNRVFHSLTKMSPSQNKRILRKDKWPAEK